MIEKLSSELKIPEFFYDALAYTIPSAMYIVGLIVINNLDFQTVFLPLNNLNSFVYEALAAFLIFGALYYLGQVCTTISYYCIAYPMFKMSKELKNYKNANDFFISFMFEIKLKAPAAVSNEIVKRYARMVLSRNIVIYSLLLFINSIILTKYLYSIIFFLFFVLSVIDSSARLQAVARETREVKVKIEKYNK